MSEYTDEYEYDEEKSQCCKDEIRREYELDECGSVFYVCENCDERCDIN